ncbi:hypothetical protein [Reyranella sp.]|uniref:hypothetical protein n=1 Tax=Reyranella sp. TaxID=1929291 RepID=UPI003D13EBF6
MGEENDHEESDEGRWKSRLWSLIDLGGGNGIIVRTSTRRVMHSSATFIGTMGHSLPRRIIESWKGWEDGCNPGARQSTDFRRRAQLVWCKSFNAPRAIMPPPNS